MGLSPSIRLVPRFSSRACYRRFDSRHVHTWLVRLGLACVTMFGASSSNVSAGLQAGAAKIDITNRDAGPVEGPLYARALVVTDGKTTVAVVSIDAVAIGEIGHIDNHFLGNVRSRIEAELKIPPSHQLINASHCHGVVCRDVEQKTIQVVREAAAAMVPVTVGAGVGREDRIMENRRLKLRDGTHADVRHAYSLPPDDQIVGIGPVDPEIGLLRLNRDDGTPLAIVYNFACHPIQGVPSGANTSDITGFASQVIEENAGPNTTALFLQGCAGDINPVYYKDVDHPRSAVPLGHMLGLSTLRAARQIACGTDSRFVIMNESLALPRANYASRIREMESTRDSLLRSLKGTSLNLETFLPLMVKYKLSDDFPAYYAHGYLSQHATGRSDLKKMDDVNRASIQSYIDNILVMERLTRLQTNLALLRKHMEETKVAEKPTIDVELTALRIGGFVLLTFPGELTVQIGLNIKQLSPHKLTFVAGYTNGYIYYAPTAKQLKNVGRAQEDSDCLLAPAWQSLFETKAAEMLNSL